MFATGFAFAILCVKILFYIDVYPRAEENTRIYGYLLDTGCKLNVYTFNLLPEFRENVLVYFHVQSDNSELADQTNTALSFSLRISSVNVTKSAGNSGFD